MWRPGGLRPPGDGVRAVGSTGGGIIIVVLFTGFLVPPFFSWRLRALPTLLRVRLYVPEMAERGVGYNGAGARVFVCGGLLIFLRRVHAGCWL